jgi:hypothetical protein
MHHISKKAGIGVNIWKDVENDIGKRGHNGYNLAFFT